MTENQTIVDPFSIPLEECNLESVLYKECERIVFDRFTNELQSAFNKGVKVVVIADNKVSICLFEGTKSFDDFKSEFLNRPFYVFVAPEIKLLTKPATMEEYIVAIQAQSTRKGWSKNKLWLQSSIYKEVSELIKALEHNESDDAIGAEMADVLYFLWQYVKAERPNVNLDNALIAKMHDNEVKKKKTIDAAGNIVRK